MEVSSISKIWVVTRRTESRSQKHDIQKLFILMKGKNGGTTWSWLFQQNIIKDYFRHLNQRNILFYDNLLARLDTLGSQILVQPEKILAKDKRSSLLGLVVNDGEKSFMTSTQGHEAWRQLLPGTKNIKFCGEICKFWHNKLECCNLQNLSPILIFACKK